MREVFIQVDQIANSRSNKLAQSGEFDLTHKPNPSYSGMRGVFMPEPGSGEGNNQPNSVMERQAASVPQREFNQNAVVNSVLTKSVLHGVPFLENRIKNGPLTSEKKEALTRQWKALYRGQGIDFDMLGVDERGVLNLIIESGAPPMIMAGGATTLPPEAFIGLNTALPDLDVTEIAKGILEVGNAGGATREFLNAQARRLEAGIDAGKFNRNDAQTLLKDVNNYLISLNISENRSRQVILERDWEVTPNTEALEKAEKAGLFKGQVREIREMWDEIDRTGKLDHERVKRIRQELIDKSAPDRESYEFYDMQGLLSHEFNRMTNQVEGNVFSDQETHVEQIEAVRKIYNELDVIPDKDTNGDRHEEKRDELYTKLENVLEHSVDFASGRLTQSSRILDVIAEESLAKHREGRAHYGLALEFAVEQIIGRGDDNATADYPQFGFYEGNNLEEMIQGARRLDRGFAMYLQNLKGKRAMSHELFKNMKDRQTFVGIVAKGLDPGSFRFIEKEVGGISEVQLLYEKELARMAAKNSYEGKGWILHDQFRTEVDVNMEKWVHSGQFDLRRQVRKWKLDRARGEWVSENTDTFRRMRTWEIKRAKNMGRAVSAASLRRQYYGVVGDTPERISERVETVEGGEEIMMLAAPIKLINERYFAYQPGSKMFLDTWCDRKVEEALRNNKKYSLKRNRVIDGVESEHDYGIFGTTERSNILMDSGTVDVKSSMWRGDKMFFDQRDFANIAYEGRNVTIGEFLFKFRSKLKKDVKNDPNWKSKSDHEIDHEVQHRFDHAAEEGVVKSVLSEQRLFLGVMQLESDRTINQQNKAMLWRKTAKLMPSRIATLMPQYAIDEVKKVYDDDNDDIAIKKWDDIIKKLAVVEYDRVQADARGLRINPLTNEPADPTVAGLGLEYYIQQRGDLGFDGKELEVIRKWQDLGSEMSSQLAQIVWPMAPFLDDVPQTDWENMGRDELKRLLVNDHNDWGEAYKGITGLIANPATAHPEKADEEVVGIMHTFVENAKSPTSLGEAQERVESFIYTWAKMAQKYPRARWTYDIGQVFRKPTSMMEEFNLSCDISYDEEKTALFLLRLARAEALSDDPIHSGGKASETRYWKMTKELDADAKAKMIMYLRFLMLIFPLEFVKELVGAILPEEISKGS